MTIKSVGYIIQDKQGYAIYGYGDTVDEAWQMVKADADPFIDAYGNEMDDETAYTTGYKTYGATAALIEKIKTEGGAIAWDVVEGVACTIEEGEQV